MVNVIAVSLLRLVIIGLVTVRKFPSDLFGLPRLVVPTTMKVVQSEILPELT